MCYGTWQGLNNPERHCTFDFDGVRCSVGGCARCAVDVSERKRAFPGASKLEPPFVATEEKNRVYSERISRLRCVLMRSEPNFRKISGSKS